MNDPFRHRLQIVVIWRLFSDDIIKIPMLTLLIAILEKVKTIILGTISKFLKSKPNIFAVKIPLKENIKQISELLLNIKQRCFMLFFYFVKKGNRVGCCYIR